MASSISFGHSLLWHVVVFQVNCLQLFCFLRSDEIVGVVFPSFLRSSHASVRSCCGTEAWVPLCCFFIESNPFTKSIVATHMLIPWTQKPSLDGAVVAQEWHVQLRQDRPQESPKGQLTCSLGAVVTSSQESGTAPGTSQHTTTYSCAHVH